MIYGFLICFLTSVMKEISYFNLDVGFDEQIIPIHEDRTLSLRIYFSRLVK